MPRKRTIESVKKAIAKKKYEVELLEIELEQLEEAEDASGGASAIGFFIDPDPED